MTQRLFQIHVYIATMSPIEYLLMVIIHDTIASRNNNYFICYISYSNSHRLEIFTINISIFTIL